MLDALVIAESLSFEECDSFELWLHFSLLFMAVSLLLTIVVLTATDKNNQIMQRFFPHCCNSYLNKYLI